MGQTSLLTHDLSLLDKWLSKSFIFKHWGLSAEPSIYWRGTIFLHLEFDPWPSPWLIILLITSACCGLLKWWVDGILQLIWAHANAYTSSDKMSQLSCVQLASQQTAINVGLCILPGTMSFLFLGNLQRLSGLWVMIVIRMLSMNSQLQWHLLLFNCMTMPWHSDKRLTLPVSWAPLPSKSCVNR